ncbi:MAG: NfeD family protein [Sulfurimonadaceae bacterium]
METQILEPFAPWVLLGIGIALVAFESFLLSFVALWFGLGCIIMALVSMFVVFEEGVWQLAWASLLALGMLFTLRTRAMEKFLEPAEPVEIREDYLNESGYGVIENGMVHYKATYWTPEHAKGEVFAEGEEVFVAGTHKGRAKISKIAE